MEDAIALLIMIVVVAIPFLIFPTIVAAIVFLIFKQHQRINSVWKRFAESRGGRSSAGGWGTSRSALFPYRGLTVYLRAFATGGDRKTDYSEAALPWPNRRFRLEVFPDGFFQRVGKLLGMTDLEIGSPAFDDHFIINGSDEHLVRQLLSHDVQAAIGNLQSAMGADIYLSIGGGWFTLRRRGICSSEEQLGRFSDLVLDLYDRIRARFEGPADKMAGITFADPVARPLAEAICQVCGEKIEQDSVFCRACKTPHHADCWQYYGACSTYGCGCRTSLPAK